MSYTKTSYVCLPCRASYKQSYGPERERHCPRCARVMIHAGSAFQPPRRRDKDAWRALSVVLNAGIGFHKSCCGGPGWRPRTLREVKARTAHARRTGEPVARALLRYELP
ncbi:deoxyxylulose-5-phosphate synthase [Streptomyces sp. NPDC126499]|uniref:deoxyxylulose-5-phosphate synthase n=1 Tax=Streptomyces sp. NPDC126499 TaxID=3155314 RepID=UPI0033201242